MGNGEVDLEKKHLHEGKAVVLAALMSQWHGLLDYACSDLSGILSLSLWDLFARLLWFLLVLLPVSGLEVLNMYELW